MISLSLSLQPDRSLDHNAADAYQACAEVGEQPIHVIGGVYTVGIDSEEVWNSDLRHAEISMLRVDEDQAVVSTECAEYGRYGVGFHQVIVRKQPTILSLRKLNGAIKVSIDPLVRFLFKIAKIGELLRVTLYDLLSVVARRVIGDNNLTIAGCLGDDAIKGQADEIRSVKCADAD